MSWRVERFRYLIIIEKQRVNFGCHQLFNPHVTRIRLESYLWRLVGPTFTFSTTVVLGCFAASSIGTKWPVIAFLAFFTVLAIKYCILIDYTSTEVLKFHLVHFMAGAITICGLSP